MSDLSWLDPRVMSYADMAALTAALFAGVLTVAVRLVLRDLRARWSR